MKTYLVSSLLAALLAGIAHADKAENPGQNSGKKGTATGQPEQRMSPEFFKAVKQGVQITELGCMRATFVFDQAASEVETRVTEAFSNADFRVFPNATIVEDRIDPAALIKIGNDRYADLVVFTRLTAREKNQLAGMVLAEAEATVQVYNPLSGELMVSDTRRVDGKRNADKLAAARSAIEPAVDAAVKEVILKTLEKAHKILVHEAQIKGVQDHAHLLEILEHTARLQGVYHARQISYDKTTKIAVIEIMAAPQTEAFWRAWVEKLPKREMLSGTEKEFKMLQNKLLRQRHESWFKE